MLKGNNQDSKSRLQAKTNYIDKDQLHQTLSWHSKPRERAIRKNPATNGSVQKYDNSEKQNKLSQVNKGTINTNSDMLLK